MNAAIRVNKLTVRKAGRAVLQKVSADFSRGRITGILGPSGAGKTTLVRTIAGLQRAGRGTVSVLDLPAGSKQLRTEVGYMGQNSAVYTDMTLIDNLRFFAKVTNTPASRIATVLRDLDLRRQAKQIVGTLSGGQLSRASLAATLLSAPQILLLDEPTVGLDPLLRSNLWQHFNKLKEDGATIIITSHAMDEAARCDELLLLRDGKLLASGTPKSLLHTTRAQTIEESFIKMVGKKK